MTTKLPPLRAGNGFCEIDESERIFSHKGAKNHRYTYVIFPQAWCTGLRRLKFQCVAPRGVGYGVAIGVVSNLNANVKSTAFFFDEKEVGHSYNLWLGNKGTQTANAVQHRYKGGTWTNIDVSDNRKLKSGDIMEAEVDFDNRCIQFLINHEEVGSPLQIEQNIALYPAIAYCCKKSFNHEERGPPKYKLLTCGSAEEEKEAQRRAEKEKAARALEERERRERAEEEEAKRKHELEKMRLAALEQKRHDEARAHELKLATEQKQLQIDMEEKARALEMKREKERQALAKEREETMRKHALEMAEIEKAKKAQEEMALRAKEEADRQAAEAKAKAEADATRLAHEQAARMAEIAKADAAQREAAKLEMAKETARLAKEAKELHQKLEKERRELEATQEKERQEREEREAKAKREHDLAMRKQKAEEEKLKAEKAREIELANQKYEREMLDLKAKQEKETEERRQKAEKDKKEREEKARVRILEERQKRRDALREEMKTAEAEITTYNKLQAKTIMDLSKSEKDEEILNVALTLHKEKYDEDIAFIQQSINAAKSKYAEAHGKIRNAINQTNVDEGSIPQFLNLINDGLIVGTLNDTAKREALNAKLGAFAELFERRTNTSLAIDTFFTDKLKPFVTYLKDEQYETMDSLLCDDEKQFNEIVVIIENGIAKTNAAIEESRKKKDTLKNDVDANHKAIHIKPIRTKQKNGGPLFEELKKLCMREIAEGPKGWVTKNDGDDEVEVETIFKGKLKPFAKYLADEDYDMMDEVLCDDEYDFEEILDIIEAGIAKDKGRPLKRGTSGKETSVMRTLKQMCMKENAEEGWMKQQQAKKAIVTVQLKEVSHPLSKFFGAMDMAVTDARSCLEYSVQKTPAQQSAIEYRKKNEAKLKAIKEKAENAAPDDDDDEAKNEEPQFLAEFRESRENGLTQNPTDMDEEKAGALDLIRDESSAFVTAAILKLHVVDAVRPIFEASKFPFTRGTGLNLARDVESCSLQIMQSQATIRSSLLIARQLVEFKPAKPDPQAAPLWEVIDAGIVNILHSYIEMTKTSATYFSFFAKFKSAMQHFEAFHEIQGDCIDVSAASIYLKRELKAFAAFGTKMKVAVDRLRGDAIAVINDCVRETRCPNNSYYLAQNARKEAAAELYRYISL
eukprot:19147_1